MSIRTTKVVGAGVPPLAASQLSGDVQTGVTATGTTQATAVPAYGDLVVVTTAAASTGVIMAGPAFGPGDTQTIINQGANAVLVYPPVGGTINALSANAGFSVGAGKSVELHAATGTQFYTVLSA
jgi:hypothetical protein